MELDGIDFIKLLSKAYEHKRHEEEEKTERLLLDIWGYQLPLMEKPISFPEFKEKFFDVKDTTLREEEQLENKTHKEKIANIRRIEEQYRNKMIGERRG